MTSYAVLLFWLCAGCIVYTYFVYPVTIALTSQIRPWPIRVGSAKPSISIIIAVYNEAATIARRLDEFVRVIGAWDHGQAEIIVVSDGSTDSTAAIARSFAERGVQLFEQASNQGKAAALNLGARVACNEILILADARQIWSETAIDCLLENFSDPSVGAVGGELILRGSNGMLVGVGLYWRFEKWLRKCESKVHSTVGVTGAICAVRRRLFPILPQGTILDDMYWPLTIVLAGYRTVYEPRAHAYDSLPEKVSDEFRRKIRTLSGNFQLVQRLPMALVPLKNSIWLQLISHKLMRLIVPWAMAMVFILGLMLDGLAYRIALCGETALIVLAVSSLLGVRNRIGSAAASFILLNAAAWCAFWAWCFGGTSGGWHKSQYEEPATAKQG